MLLLKKRTPKSAPGRPKPYRAKFEYSNQFIVLLPWDLHCVAFPKKKKHEKRVTFEKKRRKLRSISKRHIKVCCAWDFCSFGAVTHNFLQSSPRYSNKFGRPWGPKLRSLWKTLQKVRYSWKNAPLKAHLVVQIRFEPKLNTQSN